MNILVKLISKQKAIPEYLVYLMMGHTPISAYIEPNLMKVNQRVNLIRTSNQITNVIYNIK